MDYSKTIPNHKTTTKYITPGRILRKLKGRDKTTTMPDVTQAADDVTLRRLVAGEVIYRLICKHYLPFLTGGTDMHARSDFQVNSCSAFGEEESRPFSTEGVWSTQEGVKIAALLPINLLSSTLSYERICEGYVYLARLLFPTRMRCRALKALLTHGPMEPEAVRSDPKLAAESLVAKLCSINRKVYKIDMVTHQTARTDYYMNMWCMFCPMFSWTTKHTYTTPRRLFIPSFAPLELPGSALNFFYRPRRRPRRLDNGGPDVTYFSQARLIIYALDDYDLSCAAGDMRVPYVLADG